MNGGLQAQKLKWEARVITRKADKVMPCLVRPRGKHHAHAKRRIRIEPDKILSGDAIRTMWLRTINRRLQMEMLQTDKSHYGSKALKSTLPVVERTWWGVLRNQELLNDDWLKGTGVSGYI
jgi:hypothetical protein